MSIAVSDRPTPAAPLRLGPQSILAALVVLEFVIFAIVGTNFFTLKNFFEILRPNVELGLLALAMTPVIVTGGIDLSVGSLLGLCAVCFGKLWRDAGLDPALAAAGALLLGTLAGYMNGLLITKLRIPPLIVTLGSYSLFRGLAEGITHGSDNFTAFPARFLLLGQGYVAHIPVQLPILVLAAVVFWLLLHRSFVGRMLSAVGYSPEGARYAGISVEKCVALTYVLSGFCSGVAAVIYAARVGQVKADAGSNYELAAITAVVLGGTSIFGGAGSIGGTLLGLLAIAILSNGLILTGLPGELAGILTGVLLLLAIASNWKSRSSSTHTAVHPAQEELEMKNSQLAVLCGVILAAALIVTGGNFLLIRNLPVTQSSTAAPVASGEPAPAHKQYTIAMMPKSKGNAYFIACEKGAEQAAKVLGVNLLWDGPVTPDPARQNEIAETWITRGVDAIAISCENRQAVSTVLREAQKAGIKVVSFDADAEPDARSFFVNQATPQGIGYTLMDDAAKTMGNQGDFAIITSSLTASNQNEWLKWIARRREEKYPNVHQVTLQPCDDDPDKAFDKAQSILNAYPSVKLIMAICTPAVPKSAEAVEQAGRKDVHVVGLGLPNDNKKYVHEGITTAVVLWNTADLGYLTVFTANALLSGTLKPGDTSMNAGRLGKIEIQGDNVLLGVPTTFDAENIDQFDF